MSAPGRPSHRDPVLDGLRAGAAGLVLLSHARVMVLRDAADQPGLSLVGRVVFALSGLGHAAVIVFFVLSGLLVTGAMLRLAATGRWSLGAFATARLIRLWIVLVPCLVLGALLDKIGLGLVAAGQPYGVPLVGHRPVDLALGPDVWLGNILFLQTIVVPVFGSNGPLWSLANEAWYYVVAALAFAAWRARRTPVRALGPAGVAVLVLLWLPPAIVALGPVWACGAAVALVHHRFGRPSAAFRRVMAAGGLLLAGIVLPFVRLHPGPMSPVLDLALGLAVAALVFARPSPLAGASRPGATALRAVAEASYSLYISHVPVLSLYAALTIGPHRLPLGPKAVLLLGGALTLAMATGMAVWWGFERHTDRLRGWIATRVIHVRTGLIPLTEQAP